MPCRDRAPQASSRTSRTCGEGDMVLLEPAPTFVPGTPVSFNGGGDPLEEKAIREGSVSEEKDARRINC